MELIGKCTICGGVGKVFTCMLCGRLACRNCLNVSTGVCMQCSHGRKTTSQDTRVNKFSM